MGKLTLKSQYLTTYVVNDSWSRRNGNPPPLQPSFRRADLGRTEIRSRTETCLWKTLRKWEEYASNGYSSDVYITVTVLTPIKYNTCITNNYRSEYRMHADPTRVNGVE